MAARSAAARAGGVLHPIATDYVLLFDGGMPFVVRRLTDTVSRKQKSSDAARQGDHDPFLDPEPQLVVADLSDSHRVMLNKYPVLENHLLITTREFVAQHEWLTLADFRALWQTLAACDGLAFFNSHPVAGASQPHRHLQLVPPPLAAGVPGVPVTALFPQAMWQADGTGRLPQWPFAHALCRLPAGLTADPQQAAALTLRRYHQLLAATGVGEQAGAPATAAYNLLVTRDWLLLVTRRLPQAHGVAINALAFAGSLFVRGAGRWAWLGRHGPQALLAEVAG